MGRGREGPVRFLGSFEGILQTDGYAAYDRVGGPKMVHAACWAHSRRRFVDAVNVNKQDVASVRALTLMDALFAIDAQARNGKMDLAARHALRQQNAPALLDQIRTTYPRDEQGRVAPKCGRKGLQLHACAVEQADALPPPSRTGVEQQPC